MKRIFGILGILGLFSVSAQAQAPLKVRPDALPPVQEQTASKALQMAESVDEMAAWDRYPTYETYLAMMQRWAECYSALCHVDTIGTSIEGRLILSMYIEPGTDDDLYRPEFFYSSTIHGDEVTGYVMMLRLIDTLLSSYGISDRLTALVNTTRISINPLANPDGTYRRGNHTVQGSVRYNAAGVDLNRYYPDPFGMNNYAIPQENQAMIDYIAAHSFRLSANLHGGSEVMNYPWDCFTSAQQPHPQADWWREVCTRFVDSARVRNASHFRDVNSSGVIAGGDWYVIHGGRQDYVNYYHDCLELTMEISTVKTLSSNLLPIYWDMLAESFIGYIDEIHSLPGEVGVSDAPLALHEPLNVWPNPAVDVVHIDGLPDGTAAELYDMQGHLLLSTCHPSFSVRQLPDGIYLLRAGRNVCPVVVNR